MSPTPERHHFSDTYVQQLSAFSDGEVITQLTGEWSVAPLPGVNQVMPYVRLYTAEATGRPVLFVPGFTEGIVAKAPFAAEMATRNFDIILPDQHRKGVSRGPNGRRNATYTQARNFMAVLESEDLLDGEMGVDVVAHSYGALVFEAMTHLAEQRGATCFKDSTAVLLAPAGTHARETHGQLIRRFMRETWAEARADGHGFPDPDREMLRAGLGHVRANVLRCAREVHELATRRIDYPRLLSSVGSLAVVTYGADRVYSQYEHATVMAKLFRQNEDADISWTMPIGWEAADNGTPHPVHGCHNDEQMNPARIAAVLTPLLRSDSAQVPAA